MSSLNKCCSNYKMCVHDWNNVYITGHLNFAKVAKFAITTDGRQPDHLTLMITQTSVLHRLSFFSPHMSESGAHSFTTDGRMNAHHQTHFLGGKGSNMDSTVYSFPCFLIKSHSPSQSILVWTKPGSLF